MKMLFSRLGKVNNNKKTNPKIIDISLNKNDLDSVLINDEGFIYKLEDFFGNNFCLNVLYIKNTEVIKDIENQNYDLIVSKVGTSKNIHLDANEFFKNYCSEDETAVIYTLKKPQ
jgi:hypothetical protein